MMICPRCQSGVCFRSRRRIPEHVLSVVGILPWRCVHCGTRFLAGRTPLRHLHRARCPRCGNFDLSAATRKMLEREPFTRLATYFGARALRCEYCRVTFASWRPLWRGNGESEHAELEQRT